MQIDLTGFRRDYAEDDVEEPEGSYDPDRIADDAPQKIRPSD